MYDCGKSLDTYLEDWGFAQKFEEYFLVLLFLAVLSVFLYRRWSHKLYKWTTVINPCPYEYERTLVVVFHLTSVFYTAWLFNRFSVKPYYRIHWLLMDPGLQRELVGTYHVTHLFNRNYLRFHLALFFGNNQSLVLQADANILCHYSIFLNVNISILWNSDQKLKIHFCP